jgi:hypothetical protein
MTSFSFRPTVREPAPRPSSRDSSQRVPFRPVFVRLSTARPLEHPTDARARILVRRKAAPKGLGRFRQTATRDAPLASLVQSRYPGRQQSVCRPLPRPPRVPARPLWGSLLMQQRTGRSCLQAGREGTCPWWRRWRVRG